DGEPGPLGLGGALLRQAGGLDGVALRLVLAKGTDPSVQEGPDLEETLRDDFVRPRHTAALHDDGNHVVAPVDELFGFDLEVVPYLEPSCNGLEDAFGPVLGLSVLQR